MSETNPELTQLGIISGRVGDVMQTPVETELPPGWFPLDGTLKLSWHWPEFCRATGITGPRFTLPKREVKDGMMWIIKLGSETVPLTPPIVLGSRPE